MDDETKPDPSALDKRFIITTAVDHLTTRYKLSPKKAREWLWQEAMAKRANLAQVAEAILSNETVNYRYDAPI